MQGSERYALPLDYAAAEMPTLIVAGEEDENALLAGCEEVGKGTRGERSMEGVEELGH